MALVKCAECGGTISDAATACPQCGAPGLARAAEQRPAAPVKPAPKQYGCGTLILLFIVAVAVWNAFAPKAPATRSEAAKPALSDADCRKNLQCWGDRNSIKAETRCKRAVEALAKYQAEWTDGVLERKFDRFGWADQAAGTLWYSGNKIKMQNGFGAWQKTTYRCTYDPSSETATGATAT